MKASIYSLSLLVLMSCQSEPETQPIALSENNPFNVGLNEPFDYANVTGDAIEEYVTVAIKNAVQTIDNIKSEKDLTLENTFVAYDNVHNSLYQANNNAFMLYWVSTDSHFARFARIIPHAFASLLARASLACSARFACRLARLC